MLVTKFNAGVVNDPLLDNLVFNFNAILAAQIQALGQKVWDLDGTGMNFALPRFWHYSPDVAVLFDPSMIIDASIYLPLDSDTNYI